MQKISDFNDNLGVAILLTGPPGAGKSVTGCRLFPRTYVSVTDLNFKSAKDYLAKIGNSNVVGFDTPNFKDGKPLMPAQRYPNMMAQLTEAIKSPDIDAIFCDSVTFMEPIIKAHICSAASDIQIKLEGFDQWGKYLLFWQSFIMQLRNSGKKLVIAAHEECEKDMADQLFKYGLAVDGKMKNKFPAFFSDVWRCEVAENLGKHTWQIRTLGNNSHSLKNTFGFAAVMKQDDLVAEVQKRFQPKK